MGDKANPSTGVQPETPPSEQSTAPSTSGAKQAAKPGTRSAASKATQPASGTTTPQASGSAPVTHADMERILNLFESRFKQDHDAMVRALGNIARQQSSQSSNGQDSKQSRINVNGIDKLQGDVNLKDFLSWRSKWEDLSRLERIKQHANEEQVAALR